MVWKVVRGIYSFIAVLIICVLIFIWFFILSTIPLIGLSNTPVESFSIRLWNRAVFRLFFAKLSVKGLEGYDPKKPCIIISNHQSLVDIPTVYEVFSGPVKMLGKAELFKIPFFGWALTAAGLIPVDRGNREAATKTIELTKKRLSEGVQIWMAPEGTRSVDGKLGAFKGGAFRMAADLNLPIVGLVLNGTKDVLRKKSFLVNPFQQINAVVLPAVSMADVGAIDYKQFRNYFKAKFEETLADIS